MRRPVALFLLIGLFLVKTSRSQTSELLVQGGPGKLYLVHTVTPKENWYSIGRLYNQSPKDIAPFNTLTLDKPLSIGQSVEIPLTPANFSQNGQKAVAGETLVPVYHIVQEKEWMYRISVNHNKVPVENLEKWNNINKDLVKAGMHLIVGYLKVKTALSALATGSAGTVVSDGQAKTSHVIEPVSTTGTQGGSQEKNKTVGVLPSDSPAVNSVNKPPVKTVENKPAGTTGTGNTTNGAGTGSGAGKVTSTVTGSSPTTGGGTGSSPSPGAGGSSGAANPPAAHFNGGYFKTDYNDQNISATGVAGIFKSTSGWQDGKYYALMNNVAVGTIIKVTLSSTNKTIYAKVLGQLPDMKESSGMTIRISNAAASELAQADGKFNVEVRY